MRFEEIQSIEGLKNFFTNSGFEVQKHDEDIVKIDKSHFLQIKIVDILDHARASQEYKDFKRKFRDIPYQLLVDKTLHKFIFQRDYGTPIRFSYDKNKEYAQETIGSILKKLNYLKYEDSDFNTTVNNLFDVKEIVNKFYEEYKKIKNKLTSAIKNFDGDPQLYAQVIMDRIIFLYFLQTKGIMQTRTFISDLYYNKKKTENFYKDYLIPLFFQMLNTEKHSKELLKKFGSVPYLNGGLFSPKDIETKNKNIHILDSIWDHVFELLNSYEWVIEEEKGDSTTLTPSILGHIYEKSVIAATQKETGSYYTPEEITTYISKNTIYPYITDRVNRKFVMKYNNLWNELLNKTQHTIEEIEHVRYIYFDILKNLKVCDNACGSGAFLIAAQQILIPIYNRCIKVLIDRAFFKEEYEKIKQYKEWKYYIKKEIITKNLYGIDIQEGAVEIAKLRLWLSMVSEMELKAEDIEPLPNINYNILTGNSLIGYVKLPPLERWGPTIFEDDDPQKIKELLKERQKYIDLYRETASSKEAKELEKHVERINKNIKIVLDGKLFNDLISKKIKITKDEFLKLKPFHWGFEFYDVFNGQKPDEEIGFDIIIGNPPYGNILKDVEKKYCDIFFETSKEGSHNGSSVFIERSLYIIKRNGYFSYIVPNTISRIIQFSKIRELMLSNFIVAISREENPFVGVHLEMDIYIIRKSDKQYKENYKIKIFNKEHKLINKVDVSVFRKYNRFIYMWDEISYYIWKKHPINYLTSKRGPDKKYKEAKDKFFNVPFLYNHNSIDKYKVLSSVFTDDHRNAEIRNHKVLSSRNMYRIYRCIWNSNKFYPGAGIAIILKSNGQELEKTIIAVLNSKLIDYLSKRYIFNLHTKPSNLQSDVTRFTPIVQYYNNRALSILSDYMLFLNITEEQRKSEKELIEFIDKQIIDSLVYELYFNDELKTYLLRLVEYYLKDIENLKSDDEKLKVIKQVVEKIKADTRVVKEIAKIKSHPWVKIIEEETK